MLCVLSRFFFFYDTATTEIYTFPTRRSSDLHYVEIEQQAVVGAGGIAMLAIGGQFRRQRAGRFGPRDGSEDLGRSEEHTSELQSRVDLVCRLLLEKKKTADNV